MVLHDHLHVVGIRVPLHRHLLGPKLASEGCSAVACHPTWPKPASGPYKEGCCGAAHRQRCLAANTLLCPGGKGSCVQSGSPASEMF
mmetsp:Transcript_72688/g.162737  ORF Transcript_72688/g.162737 Transcript_72688/m.162737 type:complete len:87 (-) Transcript_72688:217-477(-)